MKRIDITGILWRLNKMMICSLQSPCPQINQVRLALADSLYILVFHGFNTCELRGPSLQEYA
jgi:hypothetical protein